VKQQPLIAITMRADPVAGRNEVRDALDQAWLRFFSVAGVRPLLVPNGLGDPVEYLHAMGASGLVISGGNDMSSSFPTCSGASALVREGQFLDVQPLRDQLESHLLGASATEGWPVLGVCRGMQAINLFHGGRLEPVSGHVRTRHRLVRLAPTGEFEFDAEVNSFHNYGVPLDGLGSGFVALATAGESVEAIWNEDLRQLGVMWHPERNEPFSKNDLDLFRQLFGISSE
jgi:putative glutamine amidotransferase